MPAWSELLKRKAAELAEQPLAPVQAPAPAAEQAPPGPAVSAADHRHARQVHFRREEGPAPAQTPLAAGEEAMLRTLCGDLWDVARQAWQGRERALLNDLIRSRKEQHHDCRDHQQQ